MHVGKSQSLFVEKLDVTENSTSRIQVIHTILGRFQTEDQEDIVKEAERHLAEITKEARG